MSYAAAKDAQHLPAWRAFNRRARAGASAGIWHEAYVVNPDGAHIVYSNMPPFGMGEATKFVPASAIGAERSTHYVIPSLSRDLLVPQDQCVHTLASRMPMCRCRASGCIGAVQAMEREQ